MRRLRLRCTAVRSRKGSGGVLSDELTNDVRQGSIEGPPCVSGTPRNGPSPEIRLGPLLGPERTSEVELAPATPRHGVRAYSRDKLELPEIADTKGFFRPNSLLPQEPRELGPRRFRLEPDCIWFFSGLRSAVQRR
jgi:hypothetical protein